MVPRIDYNVNPSTPLNFNWAISGELLVAFARSGTVSKDRFQEYMDAVRKRNIVYMLSITEGSAIIDSVQRKAAADLAKEQSIRIAVIIDSAITRGLVTALSWLGVNMKSFSPDQLPDAVKYLSVPGIELEHIAAMVKHLRDTTVNLDKNARP